MHEPQPLTAGALAGAWPWALASVAALTLTAAFAALVGAGWSLVQALSGAAIAASLAALGGFAVRTRTGRGTP